MQEYFSTKELPPAENAKGQIIGVNMNDLKVSESHFHPNSHMVLGNHSAYTSM